MLLESPTKRGRPPLLRHAGPSITPSRHPGRTPAQRVPGSPMPPAGCVPLVVHCRLQLVPQLQASSGQLILHSQDSDLKQLWHQASNRSMRHKTMRACPHKRRCCA